MWVTTLLQIFFSIKMTKVWFVFDFWAIKPLIYVAFTGSLVLGQVSTRYEPFTMSLRCFLVPFTRILHFIAKLCHKTTDFLLLRCVLILITKMKMKNENYLEGSWFPRNPFKIPKNYLIIKTSSFPSKWLTPKSRPKSELEKFLHQNRMCMRINRNLSGLLSIKREKKMIFEIAMTI